MKLAAWLQRERIKNRDFAERIGVAQSTISRLCNGTRHPTLRMAVRISDETRGEVAPHDWINQGEDMTEQHRAAA